VHILSAVGRERLPGLPELLPAILPGLSEYPYDQFRGYPARPAGDGGPAPWESYFLARLRRMGEDPEWAVFGRSDPGQPPLLLAARTAQWDRDHFGFPIASLIAPYCPDHPALRDRVRGLLDDGLTALRRAGVTFVSARVSGDQLDVMHALEDAGFRFYETAIWPVTAAPAIAARDVPRVRPLVASEVPRAAQIAAKHGYQRTHFFCDAGFDREQVEQMYAKWFQTAWDAGDTIAAIESDGALVGVFDVRLEAELTAHLGWTYGRTRFVAVDESVRGRGLGRLLFSGSMQMLRSLGAQRVDSAYSSRNHASAALHAEAGFRPVYEEATFHLWL
jgi:RimJ/RimL family protein N-acetyltransferase